MPVLRPSKKVLAFLERKKQEEELRKAELVKQCQGQNKGDIKDTVQLFYDVTVNKCNEYLSKGDTVSVIKVLRKLLADGNDIDYIIVRLLAFGNLLFYQFVKQARKDLLNHFEAYDEITHACKPVELIQLLKYNILELEHAAKINKVESLEATIYMFLQLADYNDEVKAYLWKRYSNLVSTQGLFHHWIYENIPHEVVVYLKTLQNDEIESNSTVQNQFDKRIINFNKIMKSFRVMECKFRGSTMLRSRLINVLRMVINAVVNDGLELPSREEFTKHFESKYTIKNADEKPLFMELLPWDFYWYISCEVMHQRSVKLFPYEGEDGKWF